jgi:hypothetical protein
MFLIIGGIVLFVSMFIFFWIDETLNEKKFRIAEETKQKTLQRLIENQTMYLKTMKKSNHFTWNYNSVVSSNNIENREKKISELKSRITNLVYYNSSVSLIARYTITQLKSTLCEIFQSETFYLKLEWLTENSFLKYYRHIDYTCPNIDIKEKICITLDFLVDELIINKIIY